MKLTEKQVLYPAKEGDYILTKNDLNPHYNLRISIADHIGMAGEYIDVPPAETPKWVFYLENFFWFFFFIQLFLLLFAGFTSTYTPWAKDFRLKPDVEVIQSSSEFFESTHDETSGFRHHFNLSKDHDESKNNTIKKSNPSKAEVISHSTDIQGTKKLLGASKTGTFTHKDTQGVKKDTLSQNPDVAQTIKRPLGFTDRE